ncbi:MAG: DNA-3-methyladenine glycosylase 2 family protein [Planctomycetota bacterium]
MPRHPVPAAPDHEVGPTSMNLFTPPTRPFPKKRAEAAVAYLRGADPRMDRLIDAVGPVTLRLENDAFDLLVRVIVSQQIAMKAARTMAGRIRAFMPDDGRFKPAAVAGLSVEDLRGCGLTNARSEYVLNAAAAARDSVILDNGHDPSDDAAFTKTLTTVRGIGPWTAQMLQIFAYGRPDVFPPGDLGVRRAIAEIYHDGEKLSPKESAAFARRWAPHRTVATWYLWRHADAADDVTEGLKHYPV